MSYTRADALVHVAGELGTLLTEVGVGATDTSDALKGVVDRSLRAIGVPQASLAAPTVADADIDKLEALLDYHALVRISRPAAPRVRVRRGTGGDVVEKQREQLVEHIKDLLTEARQRCKALGVPVDSSGFQWGSYDLDILEPWQGSGF